MCDLYLPFTAAVTLSHHLPPHPSLLPLSPTTDEFTLEEDDDIMDDMEIALAERSGECNWAYSVHWIAGVL